MGAGLPGPFRDASSTTPSPPSWKLRSSDGRLDLESLGSRIPSATWAYTVTDNELGDDFTRMGRALRRRLAGRG